MEGILGGYPMPPDPKYFPPRWPGGGQGGPPELRAGPPPPINPLVNQMRPGDFMPVFDPLMTGSGRKSGKKGFALPTLGDLMAGKGMNPVSGSRMIRSFTRPPEGFGYK
jgi:hypothetical protein